MLRGRPFLISMFVGGEKEGALLNSVGSGAETFEGEEIDAHELIAL